MIALVWAAAGVLLLGAVALLLRRAPARAHPPARRCRRLRHRPPENAGAVAALAASLLAVLVVFAVQARAQPEEAPILAPGSDAIIVIDLSGSALPSSEGITRVLLA